ncbi:MAG: hypothetical protein RR959_06100 [Erysipelotrichaceae bacterium]
MLFKLILVVFSLNSDGQLRGDEYVIDSDLTRNECVTLMLEHNKAFKSEASYSEFMCEGNKSSTTVTSNTK